LQISKSIIEQSLLRNDIAVKITQLDISYAEKNIPVKQANEAIDGLFQRGIDSIT
jgi:hypothetical protein